MNFVNGNKRDEVHLVARGISYSIRKRDVFMKLCKNKSVSQILKGIDIYVHAGSLVAIMGPSGAGKTTLLNYLSGRLFMSGTKGIIKGEIFFNGELQNFNSIQNRSSYVMQKDCLLDYLTVEETLKFAASFTLKDTSASMREERVNRLISDLKLNKCRNTYIGGDMIKGVSAGELKRTSIGVALLQNPSVIYLDEPISGLDSSLAFDILKLLSKLAKEGHTVICTVHQPSSHIFAMFDHLILLNEGELVYQGSPLRICDYFAKLGYSCPRHFNPADFVLDLIVPKTVENAVEYNDGNRDVNEIATSERLQCMMEKEVAGKPYSSINEDEKRIEIKISNYDKEVDNISDKGSLLEETNIQFSLEESVRLTEEEVGKLPNIFQASEEAEKVRKAMQYLDHRRINESSTVDTSQYFAARNSFKILNEKPCLRGICISNWCSNVYSIWKRSVINSIRNPMMSWICIAVHLLLAVILGGIWFQLRDSTGKPTNVMSLVFMGGVTAVTESAKSISSDFRNICGALFLVSTLFGFSACTALVSFQQERIIFNRETANKMYSVSAYFVGKMIADFLFQHIPATLFLIIFYWMVGLNPSGMAFLKFLLIGNLTVFAACGLFYFVGAMVDNIHLANLVGPVLLVACMLVTGFFINVKDLPCWISWLQHLSFIKHSFAALTVNQFPPTEKFGFLENYQWLEVIGVLEHRTYVSIWSLFALGIAERLIAFFILKYSNRTVGLEL